MEVCLLSLALLLFVVSALFYSYQTGNTTLTLGSYPYQGYSLALGVFGSLLTLVAFVSYSKRGKNVYVETIDFSSEDKSN
jgi:hypothetical protein